MRACTRLGTDYIDLYQMHSLRSGDSAGRGAADARRHRALRQGPLHRLLELRRLADRQGARRIGGEGARVATSRTQSFYSLAGRDLEARSCRSLRTRASACSCGARSPAASCPASSPATARRRGRRARARASTSRRSTRTGATTSSTPCVTSPTRSGATVPQVALAWLLAKPAVTSVIIGAKRVDQLDDNLGSVDLTLLGGADRAPRRREPDRRPATPVG